MTFDLVLFGVNLLPFIVGIVALLRNETEISDYILDWVGALLFGIAAVFCIKEVQDWMGMLPNALMIFRIVTTFIGVVLTAKGYWPDVRSKVSGTTTEARALLPSRNRFFGKY